jgi:hypothetical protein
MAQTTTTVPNATPAVTADKDAPIILDLGKKSRKQVRRLRKGRGKLMDRVASVIDDLKKDGSIASGAQPVIIVIRQKPRRTMFGI